MRVPFHPRFEIVESALLLNNVQETRAMLTVAVAPRLAAYLSVEPSQAHIVTVAGPVAVTGKPHLLQFSVQVRYIYELQ